MELTYVGFFKIYKYFQEFIYLNLPDSRWTDFYCLYLADTKQMLRTGKGLALAPKIP